MLTVTNIQVYNLKESVIASGYAMRTVIPNKSDEEFSKGLERCKKLTKSGFSDVSCHSNYLTGITVSFDITYPQYWSMEAQRYHWFQIVTSSSKMHRLAKMDLNTCCNKYVDKDILKVLNTKIGRYNYLVSIQNKMDARITEKDIYEAFMEMISNCPMGLELFEHVTTNYKQLQTIYFQRRHHRLKEDWGAFCKMIEELPYFKELILGE